MKILQGHFEVNPEKGNVSYILFQPENMKALIVLGHGAGAGMTHSHMEAIANALSTKGIGTFRYHFPYMERGKGGRDGKKVTLQTIQRAVEQASHMNPATLLLAGGHSFGGRMTSHAAEAYLIPHVQALIYFSFPLHAPGREGVDRGGHLAGLGLPQLFLSGTRDTFAKKELLEQVIHEGEDFGKLHWLEGADHGYKVLKRSGKKPEEIYEEMSAVVLKWIENL